MKYGTSANGVHPTPMAPKMMPRTAITVTEVGRGLGGGTGGEKYGIVPYGGCGGGWVMASRLVSDHRQIVVVLLANDVARQHPDQDRREQNANECVTERVSDIHGGPG